MKIKILKQDIVSSQMCGVMRDLLFELWTRNPEKAKIIMQENGIKFKEEK